MTTCKHDFTKLITFEKVKMIINCLQRVGKKHPDANKKFLGKLSSICDCNCKDLYCFSTDFYCANTGKIMLFLNKRFKNT